MTPIIRRTITITIIETWAITWPDSHEISWHETPELAWPADPEPDERLSSLIDHEASDGTSFDPDAADAMEDE